jgi:hypothetical protein
VAEWAVYVLTAVVVPVISIIVSILSPFYFLTVEFVSLFIGTPVMAAVNLGVKLIPVVGFFMAAIAMGLIAGAVAAWVSEECSKYVASPAKPLIEDDETASLYSMQRRDSTDQWEDYESIKSEAEAFFERLRSNNTEQLAELTPTELEEMEQRMRHRQTFKLDLL